MTDKELIKQEIERLQRNLNECISPNNPILPGTLNVTFDRLKDFIDSLQDEPVNEDLEEELRKILDKHYYFSDEDDELRSIPELAKYIAHHFAEWQKQKDYKMYAHVPLKDMHDAWQELKKNKSDIENYPAVCFQKGADWRENQMKEALQTEYEKGRFDMQQEMMKNAVGAQVFQVHDIEKAYEGYVYIVSNQFKDINLLPPNKVKIIIVKEEQQ